MRKGYYPKEIYEKITDDPSTWFGLASKWEAVQKAQEDYDRYFRPNWEVVAILSMLAAMIAVGGMAVIVNVTSKLPL